MMYPPDFMTYSPMESHIIRLIIIGLLTVMVPLLQTLRFGTVTARRYTGYLFELPVKMLCTAVAAS